MIDDHNYKTFLDAIHRVTFAGYDVQFKGEFTSFVLIVPGIGHYHCIDDKHFPVGATNWLNSLKVGYIHEPNDEANDEAEV